MLFLGYKNSKFLHFFSAFFAGAIHLAVGFCLTLPSNPIAINPQTIQVSLVSPSSLAKKSESNFFKETILVEEKNSPLKQEKNQEKLAKNKDDNSTQNKITSGKIDPNATALKSAETEVVFDAKYLNNPAPSYPDSARQRGIEGKVLIEVVVKSDGSAKAIEIRQSSGSKLLDFAALEAVKKWRFIPAYRGKEAIQASVIVPVEFKIV